MKTLLTFTLLLAIAIVANAQKILVRGVAKDTTSARFFVSSSVRVILNDTLQKSYPRPYYLRLNKRKPDKRTLAQRRAQEGKDSIAYAGWLDLHKDKSVVMIPDKEGRFEILARPTDSLIFQAHNFITQRHAVKDLLQQQHINIQMQPIPCEPYFVCEEKNPKLYVFIAEKISAKSSKPNYCPENGRFYISADSRYEAKYKILKNLYGGYSKDTISFLAYDHYGKPPFLAHKYVMLFIREYCGRLFQEKYQYFDVYPTADGRWARPGDPYRFDTQQPKTVKVQKLKFKGHLSFDISNEYEHIIEEEYPKPYFRITKNRAYPLTGVYSEDLFAIKMKRLLAPPVNSLDSVPPSIKK